MEERDLDLVYGYSADKKQHDARNLGTILIRTFDRTVFRVDVRTTSFRAMRRETVEGTYFYDLNFTYVDGLLGWVTHRVGDVAVEHRARQVGRCQAIRSASCSR